MSERAHVEDAPNEPTPSTDEVDAESAAADDGRPTLNWQPTVQLEEG